MLFFILTSKDSEHGGMGCMGMMHNTREKELENEILALKEELRRSRK
jgi:hypothetical protein